VADGQGAVVEIVNAHGIDAQKCRIAAALVIDIDAAGAAEVVLGHAAVPAVQAQRVLSAGDVELLACDGGHQRVALVAQRAVAHDEFFEFGVEGEADGLAMAGAGVFHHSVS
jgi:hypothetical protein